MGGRRAGRQDARHRRPRPHRQARGPAGAGLRHAARRLRPVRVAPSGPGRCRVELVALDDAWSPSPTSSPIHLPKTPETIGPDRRRAAGARPSPGCASSTSPAAASSTRTALAEAIREGRIGGAALDVFATEPTTESPLFDLDSASSSPRTSAPAPARRRTRPATPSPRWCSWPWPASSCRSPSTSAPPRRPRRCGPFLPLAERLGRLFAVAGRGRARRRSRSSYEGQIADYDTRILTLSVLKGFFGGISDEPVSYVNAPQLAEEHGVEVRETSTTTARDYVNLITVRGGDHVAGRHARRAAGRAPHRDGRRPHHRRAAGRATCWSCATTTGPG